MFDFSFTVVFLCFELCRGSRCLRCGALSQATRRLEAQALQDDWASSFREVSAAWQHHTVPHRSTWKPCEAPLTASVVNVSPFFMGWWMLHLESVALLFHRSELWWWCQVRYVDDVLRADDDSAYLAFIVDRSGPQVRTLTLGEFIWMSRVKPKCQCCSIPLRLCVVVSRLAVAVLLCTSGWFLCVQFMNRKSNHWSSWNLKPLKSTKHHQARAGFGHLPNFESQQMANFLKLASFYPIILRVTGTCWVLRSPCRYDTLPDYTVFLHADAPEWLVLTIYDPALSRPTLGAS